MDMKVKGTLPLGLKIFSSKSQVIDAVIQEIFYIFSFLVDLFGDVFLIIII
jgi:hypothetical protein